MFIKDLGSKNLFFKPFSSVAIFSILWL